MSDTESRSHRDVDLFGDPVPPPREGLTAEEMRQRLFAVMRDEQEHTYQDLAQVCETESLAVVGARLQELTMRAHGGHYLNLRRPVDGSPARARLTLNRKHKG